MCSCSKKMTLVGDLVFRRRSTNFLLFWIRKFFACWLISSALVLSAGALMIFLPGLLPFGLSSVTAAYADVDVMDREAVAVEIVAVNTQTLGSSETSAISDRSTSLSASRFCPILLSVECDPVSIEAGIDCGMEWMCGLYPCLCGSADAWGGCSCNGLETIYPGVSFSSSDESVLRVVEAFGKVWLIPISAGYATVTADVELRYHDASQVLIEVEVGAMTGADWALIGIVFVCVALLAGFVVLLLHAIRRCRHARAGEKT